MTALVFRAMGGDVDIQAPGPAGDAGSIARQTIERDEQILSRFLPWSELERLNHSAPAVFRASPVLLRAVQAALYWAHATDGVFDPSVRDDLERCGYNAPFASLQRTAPTPVAPRQSDDADPRWSRVQLDAVAGTIRLPAGLRLDLGGIGKGFVVDDAVARSGAPNIMVNAAGDLYATGTGPEGGGWVIAVQDPHNPEQDIALLRVRDRGVATSGSSGRWWIRGDARYHHLIDPRTHTSADSDVLQATVIARDATSADVLAKTVLLLGSRAGLRFAERHGAAALVVDHRGTIIASQSWKEYAA